MANTTYASNIIIDPHTLLGVSQAILERISPRADRLGPYARQLLEQLRPLFIDTHQGLFVFGTPDNPTLAHAKLYAQPALKGALNEIFDESVRIELVVFNEGEDSLPALIAEFSEQGMPASQAQTGQPVEVSTGTAVEQEAPIEADETAGRLNTIQVGLIQSNLRSVFTAPKRVVVVPGYLLRWIPYIGPLRTSIVAACFQAFYFSKRTTARANLAFEAPGPFLAAMAGVAESSIWRHLDDAELRWFFKKVPYKPGEKRWVRDKKAGLTKKKPTRILFRTTTPLTPGDARALSAYLMDLNIQQDPIGVLTDLVRGEYRVEPRDVFPFPAPPPPEGWLEGDPDDSLIHNIIFSATGIETKTAPKDLTDLVDELVERLLPANDQLHLSWYFLLHWLPLLGHGPGWATILLRDRCFYNRQTGELRDMVNVRGGYQELASALGLQRTKTVREWFPAPQAQKEAVKSADLSSQEALEKIAQSKRGFVKEYAAKFVEIIDAKADGRGQVSAFKAQVKLFDPLTPIHEALYDALYPLAQGYFILSQEQRAAFLNAFEETSAMEASSTERIIQECGQAVEEIAQRYGVSIQAGTPWTADDNVITDFLGAIERITCEDSGAIGRFTNKNPGANERKEPSNPGASDNITAPDLGGFERFIALLLGTFERITIDDLGAFERMGLVFWAQMRGLKHLVLNNHLCEALKEYFQNTDPENTEQSTTNEGPDNDNRLVDVREYPKTSNWDANKLLDNFSPHIKQELFEKGVRVEAVLSCLFYIASSKGDNLGLGYVVEKLKAHPQEGQGGIYYRIAKDEPEGIVAKLQSYLEYRGFQNRDWRVAMGTPSTEKILELLEHLGFDSSKFGSRWE